jgi:hypothetical protein
MIEPGIIQLARKSESHAKGVKFSRITKNAVLLSCFFRGF